VLLTHLFGLDITQRRFYTFMASSKLPWENLWIALWKLIPNPLTDGRLLLVLDDFINTKVGKKYSDVHMFLTMLLKRINPNILGRNALPVRAY